MAVRGKYELTIGICIGSSIVSDIYAQTAIFLIPPEANRPFRCPASRPRWLDVSLEFPEFSASR